MKRVLVFAVFACTIDRHVTLLLGPDDTTLTTGFTCDDPNGSGLPLLAEAWSGSNDMLTFQLVVDVIDVGEHVPSCLGEDIEAACADGACELSVADAVLRPRRSCYPRHGGARGATHERPGDESSPAPLIE